MFLRFVVDQVVVDGFRNQLRVRDAAFHGETRVLSRYRAGKATLHR